MGGAVFKTVEAEDLGLGGSIPLRLRHLRKHDPQTPVSAELEGQLKRRATDVPLRLIWELVEAGAPTLTSPGAGVESHETAWGFRAADASSTAATPTGVLHRGGSAETGGSVC